MKKLIIILAIVFMTSMAFAESVFEAVTPDGKETDIGKVKVRETINIENKIIDAIKLQIPTWTLPEPRMHRLELIDKEIADLEAQRDKITAQIAEKQSLRDKVGVEAKKVVLK